MKKRPNTDTSVEGNLKGLEIDNYVSNIIQGLKLISNPFEHCVATFDSAYFAKLNSVNTDLSYALAFALTKQFTYSEQWRKYL